MKIFNNLEWLSTEELDELFVTNTDLSSSEMSSFKDEQGTRWYRLVSEEEKEKQNKIEQSKQWYTMEEVPKSGVKRWGIFIQRRTVFTPLAEDEVYYGITTRDIEKVMTTNE